MKHIKQVFFLILLAAIFSAYVAYARVTGITTQPVSEPVTPVTPVAAGSGTSTGTSSGEYKDGSYVGSVADAYFGNLQVEAVISGGKITDVQFLQAPHDQSESVKVNARSSPLLRSEAIQTQNAKVDIVSGATQSSEAFQQSLASALAQATLNS